MLLTADRSGSAAGELLHHETRAAARHVRDDCRAPVDLGDESQIDGECELHLLPLAQAQILGLDEHAVRAQVLGLADAALASGHHHIDGGACAVAGVQTTLHRSSPNSCWLARAPIMHIGTRFAKYCISMRIKSNPGRPGRAWEGLPGEPGLTDRRTVRPRLCGGWRAARAPRCPSSRAARFPRAT